jgi:hypothetical protein
MEQPLQWQLDMVYNDEERDKVVPKLARTEDKALLLVPPSCGPLWWSAWDAQFKHYLPAFAWNRRKRWWVAPLPCLVRASDVLCFLIMTSDPPMTDGARAWLNEHRPT